MCAEPWPHTVTVLPRGKQAAKPGSSEQSRETAACQRANCWGNSCRGQAQIRTEATCEHMQKRPQAGPEQVWAAVRRHSLVQGDSSNHPASWEGANLAQSKGRIQQGQRGQAVSRGGSTPLSDAATSEFCFLSWASFAIRTAWFPKAWCKVCCLLSHTSPDGHAFFLFPTASAV